MTDIAKEPAPGAIEALIDYVMSTAEERAANDFDAAMARVNLPYTINSKHREELIAVMAGHIAALDEDVDDQAAKLATAERERNDAMLEVTTLKAQLEAQAAVVEGMRKAMVLAECQYLGAGGNLTPQEALDSTRRVLNDALASLPPSAKGTI